MIIRSCKDPMIIDHYVRNNHSYCFHSCGLLAPTNDTTVCSSHGDCLCINPCSQNQVSFERNVLNKSFYMEMFISLHINFFRLLLNLRLTTRKKYATHQRNLKTLLIHTRRLIPSAFRVVPHSALEAQVRFVEKLLISSQTARM